MNRIGIIGTGAFGTALAQALRAEKECDIMLCARRAEVAESINRTNAHDSLPGVKLHAGICATATLSDLRDSAVILAVTPAQHMRAALRDLKKLDTGDTPVILCAKGIELESGKLLSQVAAEEIPHAPVGVLTGPTFAADIARGLPTAFTLALKQGGTAVRDLIASRTLRPYLIDDVIGAQVGGAVKNVIGIACGIVTGKGLGESARAALMTRGLAEMARLAVALGGKKETLMGLCGIGDLLLTCSSPQSRNYSLGIELGKGRPLKEILGERTSVTEGVSTAQALSTMTKKLNIDMPIAAMTNRVLQGELVVDEALSELLNRPLRGETE